MDENQNKGNLTPFMYLKSGKGKITYDEFKTYVLSVKDSKKMPKKKREYLLFEQDIQKWDVQKDFINRNLVDTRYATREVLSLLKAYFKDNELPTKVSSINGSFTNFLRNTWQIPKDRDENYSHHATDALIIAMSNSVLQNFDNVSKYQLRQEEKDIVDRETGEIIAEDQFDTKIKTYVSSALNIKKFDKFKYSHMVDRKANRQFTNDTVYSTRIIDNEEYVINKLTGIYDKDNKKIIEFFGNQKKRDTLLIARHDPKTFDIMVRIFEEYKDSTEKINPFYTYKQEFGMIRKYAKDGKGPEIKSLKYQSDKLGSHMNLSHKYPTISPDRKVVMLSQKPYRMDVYYDGQTYKFVTVRYAMLKDTGKWYELDMERYRAAKKDKGINEKFEFIFSLNRSDVIILDGQKMKFLGVNNDQTNRIECDFVKMSYKNYEEAQKLASKQLMPTLKKETKEFRKILVSTIGDEFPCEGEKLQTTVKK